MVICWIILFVNQIIILVFIFYEFIITIGLQDLRLVCHTFNIVLIGISLACIYTCKKAKSYFTIPGMKENADKNFLDLVYLINLFGFGLSIFNYFIIIRKSRQEYMWMGSALIFFCCILTCFNHVVYRDASNIQSVYEQTWFKQMPFVSRDYMDDEMNCEKYVYVNIENESVYSLHCNLDHQTLVWEDNKNLKVEERSYQVACLNQNCKGVLANMYSIWHYRLNIFLLCQIVSFFLVSIVFYQISLINTRKKFRMNNFDFFFGFCTFALVGFVLIYFCFNNFIQPPQLNEENVLIQ